MSFFIWNIIFAAVWIFITGTFTMPNLALGFVSGSVSLYVIRDHIGAAPYLYRMGRILSLVRLFLYELMMSGIAVAALVLRPNMNLKSGIFAYETELTKDSHITLLANLITLTPGTLTVDVSDNKRVLYIHAVDCSDIDATRASIRNGFERKIMEAFGDLV